MLSWFKKTKSAPAPAPAPAPEPAPAPVAPPPPAPPRASNAAVALAQRWDASIEQIRAQLRAVLDEAVAASEPLIAAIRTDLTPLVLPWNTITPRVHALREELSHAWNKISDEMSASGAFSHEAMYAEGCKRDLAGCDLELMHERALGSVMARAAERMLALALASDAAVHACNHCGAQLDRVTAVSRSLNVNCAYCTALNTVHPGDAMRMFAASGALHLAADEAREAGEAMRRLETQLRQYRDKTAVPLAMLVELEATTYGYWSRRLEVEARYNPDDAPYIPAKLERHMKDATRTLRQYWQWRDYEAAGRPPIG